MRWVEYHSVGLGNGYNEYHFVAEAYLESAKASAAWYKEDSTWGRAYLTMVIVGNTRLSIELMLKQCYVYGKVSLDGGLTKEQHKKICNTHNLNNIYGWIFENEPFSTNVITFLEEREAGLEKEKFIESTRPFVQALQTIDPSSTDTRYTVDKESGQKKDIRSESLFEKNAPEWFQGNQIDVDGFLGDYATLFNNLEDLKSRMEFAFNRNEEGKTIDSLLPNKNGFLTSCDK